jgi:ferritin-like metal-binding protein YciE
MIKEGLELIEAEGDEEVRDVGLICAAQRIEHYEIAMYGCLRTFAGLIDRKADIKLLDKNLKEEKGSDVALTVLAMGVVNDKAKADGEPVAASAR